MGKQRAVKMYDYNVWANRKIFGHLKQQPQPIYSAEIKSVFPSISEVLFHIYLVDTAWLETMKGTSYENTSQRLKQERAELGGKQLDELEQAYEALAEEFYRFLEAEEDLERVLEVEHPHYGHAQFILADLIHHVVNHGTYHRGNISAMMHQQGEKGVPTDYIFFLDE